MKKYILLSCLITVSLSCSRHTQKPADLPPVKETGFYNPLLGSGPDPWVYKKDQFFYYTNTMVNNISIWRTTAISELSNASAKVVWTPPTVGPNSRNIWAPELYYLQGKWYLYYTAGASSDLATQRCFVLENSSSDPLSGTWIDKGKIGDPQANYFSIDGTVLDYKSKLYFIWSGQISSSDNTQRIYIAEMENPWTLKGSRTEISAPQYAWEKNGSAVNEGPEALKNFAGNVFVVYSGSNCATDDYGLGMLSLKPDGDPLIAGDWTKSSSPVFSKSINNNVFGPGHNGFFKSSDNKEDWIIYHANGASGQGCGGTRSPRIQKFTWKADGTPDFGEPVSIGQKLIKPSGE
jgi:GH43 family beta-xylosidase